MKQTLALIFSLGIVSLVFGQSSKVAEPEFVGSGFFLNQDNSTTEVDRGRIATDTKIKLTSISVVVKTDGCCANTVVENTGSPLKLVMRAKNNSLDPTSQYLILKFETDKKGDRVTTVLTASMKKLTGQDKISGVLFSGKKYGESSYLLSLSITSPGEYGIFESDGSMSTFLGDNGSGVSKIGSGLFFRVK